MRAASGRAESSPDRAVKTGRLGQHGRDQDEDGAERGADRESLVVHQVGDGREHGLGEQDQRRSGRRDVALRPRPRDEREGRYDHAGVERDPVGLAGRGQPTGERHEHDARDRHGGQLHRVEPEDVEAGAVLTHLHEVHGERDGSQEGEDRTAAEAVARSGQQREADDRDADRDDGET